AVMRPVGALVHLHRRTVELPLVARLSFGSVPGAFGGTYVLHLLSQDRSTQHSVEILLGASLLLGACAMAVRALAGSAGRSRVQGGRGGSRLVMTTGLGLFAGVIVGLTSVGAGSLVIVGLGLLFPELGGARLVGTDLAQAIPLAAAGALGALAFGHLELGLTAAIVVGGVPGVLAGALFSRRLKDRHLGPLILLVVLASGLKYVGVPGDQVLLVAAILALTTWFWWVLVALSARRMRRAQQ
ncbi:MAG: sulfite exporter TauE/SafE family protein, partial [Acidimicrobiales bacterium]